MNCPKCGNPCPAGLREIVQVYCFGIVACNSCEHKASYEEWAAAAPAHFRLITPETQITVPCVLAIKHPDKWDANLCFRLTQAQGLAAIYTHWLPIAWPEVG